MGQIVPALWLGVYAMKNLELFLPESGLFAISDNSTRETLAKEGFALKGMGPCVFKGYAAFVRVVAPRVEKTLVVTPRGRKVYKTKRFNAPFTKGQFTFALARALNVSPKLAACALSIAIANRCNRNPYDGADGNHFAAKSNGDIFNQVGGHGHSAHSSHPISKGKRNTI